MSKLCTLEEARAIVASGATAILAGDEALLRALPQGNWIGGTIPYFMAAEGGVHDAGRVFVTVLPEPSTFVATKVYNERTIARVASDGPDNGYSVIIVPSGSPAHLTYAQNAPTYDDMFLKPVVGWVAGVGLDQLGTVAPLAFDGKSGQATATDAVVLHVSLPDGWLAHLDTLNLFHQGEGDRITFDKVGFSVEECRVNGEPRRFAEYLAEKEADTRLPLVGNFSGAQVNTSFQAIDAASGLVSLYAPVFPGVTYKLAAPIGDYAAEVGHALAEKELEPVWACNCILNYLYGELEGKKTGAVTGPITFGEIAYQLLNQTMACLYVEEQAAA